MASDHIPVETVLLYNHTPTPNRTGKDFKKTDEKLFLETLASLLPSTANIVTRADLDGAVEETIRAIQTAADIATPDRVISLKSVPGFNEDCKEAIAEVKRTQRRWLKPESTEEDLIEFQTAKRRRKQAIATAQRNIHRKKVSEVKDEKGLWALSRWTRNRGSRAPAFTPDIKKADGTMAEETEEKAEALRQTFFPQPPEADLTDTHYYNYNRPAESWTPIVEYEVREALRLAPPDKAPGEDENPNRILKLATDLLAPLFTFLFNKSMDMKYCPTKFKMSITVALRKPGKDDYSQPKSYRPIALMNTMGKILDTVLARRIQYYAERYHMLPTTHTGGRKQSSCEHAVHLLLEKVHSAWRKRKAASLLMLDVSGAFDNVSHERLLHNMRKRGLPLEIIEWTASYLTDRKTRIKLYEGLSQEFDVLTGIPQGSPLSPILYLFYNADLLEIARSNELVTGYIDDTSFLVEGSTTESTVHKLEVLHAKADEWARTHASVFAPAKYELIHFIHKGDKRHIGDSTRAVNLGPMNGVERVIEPKTHARYLGVILDSELNGMKHMDHVKERVGKSIQALGSIAGSTWGASRDDMLTLVKAIVMPQMLFACSTWWISNPVHGRKTHRKKMVQALNDLQKRALCAATGAFKSTAASVLEAETDTLPIDVQLDRTCMITANRIKASPLFYQIRSLRERGIIIDQFARLSPLQEIEIKIQRVIGGEAHSKIEKQIPIVAPPWWIPPTIRIAPDAETAVKEHDEVCKTQQYTHMTVFTDGSDIQGRVGAAAWEPHRRWKCLADIGPSSQFTVYGAELIGIWMAMDMAAKGGDIVKRLTIFTDNQASIISSARPRNQSGQLILTKIHALASVLQKRGCEITLRWIPAHVGVPGNEVADLLAKQATGWQPKSREQNSAAALNPPAVTASNIIHMVWLPQLLSSCKRMVNTFARECWNRNWRNGITGMLYKKRWQGNGMALNKHVNQLYKNLSHKAEAAVLIQMRTEKIGLHGYLNTINRTEDPWSAVDRPIKQCVTSLKTASVLKILDPRTWGRALSGMQGSS